MMSETLLKGREQGPKDVESKPQGGFLEVPLDTELEKVHPSNRCANAVRMTQVSVKRFEGLRTDLRSAQSPLEKQKGSVENSLNSRKP
jgi:hypothetical protein